MPLPRVLTADRRYWAIAAICLTPLLATLVAELWFADFRSFPASDQAVLELQTLHASRAVQLVGPYSRFAWNHPGPIYFYAMLPIYLLAGRETGALHVAATLLNLAAALGMLVVGAQLFRQRRERQLLLLLTATLFIGFRHHISPFSAIWNPLICLLPFTLLYLLAARLALGRLGPLPAIVVVYSFVCQTHIAYVLCATVLVATAALWGAWRAARRSTLRLQLRTRWPTLALSAALAAGLWAPPLVQQLTRPRGNLTALVEFFMQRSGSHPLGATLFAISQQLARPPIALLELVGIDRHFLNDQAAPWISAAHVVLLGLALWRARRRGRPAVTFLCTVGLAMLAIAPAAVSSIRGKLHDYLLLWLMVIGAFNWLAIALALLPSDERTRARGWRSSWSAVGLFVLALSIAMIGRIAHGYRDKVNPLAHHIAAVVDVLTPQLKRSKRPVLLRTANHNAWVPLAGIILELYKRGVVFSVDRKWRFMFGHGIRYASWSSEQRLIGSKPTHRGPLLFRSGGIFVYARPLASLQRPGQAELIAAQGVAHGDPSELTDGVIAPASSRWNDARCVQLREKSAITVRVPAANMAGILVSADSNDRYLVSGSSDGRRFVQLGELPIVRGRGMRDRQFFFNDDKSWSYLRIRPIRGDGRYSVSEIVPIVHAPWPPTGTVRAPAPAQARAQRLIDGSLPEGFPPDQAPAVQLEPGAPLVIELQPSYLAGLQLQADADDRYTVEGSVDGERFEVLHIFEPGAGSGLRSRLLLFHQPLPPCRALRIRAEGGDGLYALGGLRALLSPQTEIDTGGVRLDGQRTGSWSKPKIGKKATWLAIRGASAGLTVSLLAGQPHLMHIRAACVEGARRTLAISWNGAQLGRIGLSQRLMRATLPIPAARVSADNRLQLRPSAVPSKGSGCEVRVAHLVFLRIAP